MEKTDRLMMGVKRGIEEMKGGGGGGAGSQEAQGSPSPSVPSAGAVPLRSGTATGGERDRSRESLWPVVEAPRE